MKGRRSSSCGAPGGRSTSSLRERERSIGRWLFSFANGWIAAFITQREYQASLAFLRSLSDEELRKLLGRTSTLKTKPSPREENSRTPFAAMI